MKTAAKLRGCFHSYTLVPRTKNRMTCRDTPGHHEKVDSQENPQAVSGISLLGDGYRACLADDRNLDLTGISHLILNALGYVGRQA